MVEMGSGSSGRQAAMDWLMSNASPDLLPTPWLTDVEFEDFTEALLKAQPLLGSNVRHVAHVARWGVRGDKQDGIDFFGRFNDDVRAAWQCKQLERLRPFEVRRAVDEMTFDGADEHYLVYGRVAGQQAREEIRSHPGWLLTDRRDLTDMLRLLPTHAQRDIIERFWGADVRRRFVEAPEDGFVSLATFRLERLNRAARMNDLGPMAGRDDELASLRAAMNRQTDTSRQVIIVVGPGGRGKSRLVVEALAMQQEREPTVPIVCLRTRRSFGTEALRELRPTPWIVFIDDAHTDPTSLIPLLEAARQMPDLQVILAARPSALSAVDEQVSLALFGPDERTTIEVSTLELPHARALVRGLVDDLGLRFEMRNYLAEQAVHSPHVAVITANLIRRQELSGSLAVDENLRSLVLARYQDLLIAGDVEGVEAATTHRVIATYASIGPVQSGDEELKSRIAAFCDLTIIELARLVRVLTERGVFVENGDGLRVVPDVLADRLTEIAAAEEGYDTGFVAELWNQFGPDSHHRLALSLGELDWRLTRVGGPRVMAPVWAAIRERLQTPYCSRLCDELVQLDQLAATQPADLVRTLDELRSRLDRDDAAGAPPPEDPDEHQHRRLFGLRPIGRDDVRARLPKLYARAAVNDPDLLESVLDALWSLRRTDSRPTNSNAEHAERMVADQLAKLSRLPDPSFPERIVARASVWLDTFDETTGVSTPLFVLKPLLVKNELETFAAGPRKVGFQPHLISARATRVARDQIRTLLLQQGTSDRLRLAGTAIGLLGDALHPPHGYFGQAIGVQAILQWEDDDLATVSTLDEVATRTASAAVRRQVREVTSWSAEHATSLRLRHAALVLVARIDAMDGLEDQIAELILSGDYARSPRVDNVPTLEELDTQRKAEHERTKDFTEEEANEDRTARVHEEVEARRELARAHHEAVARQLIDLGDIGSAIALLDKSAREVNLVRPRISLSLWGLWDQFEIQAPSLLGEIVRGVADIEPGPLDEDLSIIIHRWIGSEQDDALTWVASAVDNGRKEIRLAIAAGFARFQWHQLGAGFGAIWTQGADDPDPTVAQAFLAGAGGYLRQSPAEAARFLLDHDVDEHGASRALDGACRYDGRSFGAGLDLEAATGLLPLITRAGFVSHAVRGIVTGIASAHPVLVLDHLAERFQTGERLPDNIDDLGSAFEADVEVLAGWVRQHLATDARTTGRVLATAVNDHLTERQAAGLAMLCADLDARELDAFCTVLAYITIWAVDHVQLADAVMRRARAVQALDDVRPRVLEGMQLLGWGWVNGVSDELNHAHEQAGRAAAETSDDDLRVDYEEARDRFRAEIEEVLRDHGSEESEEDW